MPCNSSYMEPNDLEINLSQVYGILDEFETGKLPENFGTGFDKRVYNKHLSTEHLDEKVAELCKRFKHSSDTKIKKLSLEAQMWWRDHQLADKNRLAEERKAKRDAKTKEALKSKLTASERKLLNL